jgi:phosphate transport system substrate-binding protein
MRLTSLKCVLEEIFLRRTKMDKKVEKYLRHVVVSTITLAVVLTISSGCSKQGDSAETEQRFITVKGSDTMVHLVSTWAEAFMQQNPGTEVSVTGGGSGTGIAALLNGTTDICAASRKIKNKELELALKKNIHPNEIAVARDGIAVVVHPDNPVNELTLEQLGGIFAGESLRWSDVGGPDEQIIVLSRESSSGTYVFFQEMVLKKQDYIQEAKLLPATSAIIQSVSTDKWAIGYVGLGYAHAAEGKVKIVPVKTDDASPAVMPSDDTVKSGQYPIARALYLYLNGEPKGTVKKFIDFCLSAEGQKVVTDTGYVAVR